jgi:hypothetical protein
MELGCGGQGLGWVLLVSDTYSQAWHHLRIPTVSMTVSNERAQCLVWASTCQILISDASRADVRVKPSSTEKSLVGGGGRCVPG